MSSHETLGNSPEQPHNPADSRSLHSQDSVNSHQGTYTYREINAEVLPIGGIVSLSIKYERGALAGNELQIERIPMGQVTFLGIESSASDPDAQLQGIFAYPNGVEFPVPADMLEITPIPAQEGNDGSNS